LNCKLITRRLISRHHKYDWGMSMNNPTEHDSQYVYPSEFSLENLRSFEAKTSVSLSRINLIFGANSAGKSTLGKAIIATANLGCLRGIRDLTNNPSISLARRLLFRPKPGAVQNHFERAFGSDMDTLSFGNNQDPIKISVSTEEALNAPGKTKVEFTIKPIRFNPLSEVTLSTEDQLLAKWGENGSAVTDLGAAWIREINSQQKISLKKSDNLLGYAGFPGEKLISDQRDAFLAADIMREVIWEGLGEGPLVRRQHERYEQRSHTQTSAVQSTSGSVNQMIRSIGMQVRITEPRIREGDQVFDEASGLMLKLDQMGSGISQIISVAQSVSGASIRSRSLGKLRSDRFPIVLIQEPEAHLHPLKQAEIGEMLCRESVRNPMRILIETHSDALLFRCLKLIRRGEIRHDLLRVIFVEQDARGRSTARNLQVGPDGALLDPFPIGFLDWGLEDLIGQ
jgi:predicted ATPase